MIRDVRWGRRDGLVLCAGGLAVWAGVAAAGPARFPEELRSIDGFGNNVQHPAWGAAGEPFVRLVPAAYGDGVGAPSGADRPGARSISNAIAAQAGSIPNTLGASDYLWQWGQFLDHDIAETPLSDPAESFDAPVPTGDPWFDPGGAGDRVIPLTRSAWSMHGGVREQHNEVTAYIDASNVYGSGALRALELRTLDGTGRLKTSSGNLLPFNVNGFSNAPSADLTDHFLAGDVRCNEQVGLIAMHTLWVREHNTRAGEIRARHPEFDGDTIYEHARAIVAAEMQHITYTEFLPLLLGPGAMPAYTGYRPEVDATLGNGFATAAYRVGHTMLSPVLRRVGADGREIPEGDIALADAFFNPGEIISTGIEPVLRGLAMQLAQRIDHMIVDDVRNLLFGAPGSGGLDLATLNVQRGRDHGLPGYNAFRVRTGRPAAQHFEDINPDPEVASRFASVYADPDGVDLWIGALGEPAAPGALVGPTLRRMIADQFAALRDGDRFWYESYLPAAMLDMVRRETLSSVIRRNTPIGDELQRHVFRVGPSSDLDRSGAVDVFDILRFFAGFAAHDPECDWNRDLVFDVLDIIEYLHDYADRR